MYIVFIDLNKAFDLDSRDQRSPGLFDIRSGVKQGCVLAPTPFGIVFALLQTPDTTTEGVYLRTRSDGRLFNLAHLRAKTKLRESLVRDVLFADDATVATHTQEELQALTDRFFQACKDFGLTISQKNTDALPIITIDDYELDAVHQFTYLGSTITDNLSLDTEIDKRQLQLSPAARLVYE